MSPEAVDRTQSRSWTQSPVAPALIALFGVIVGAIVGASVDWWKSGVEKTTADLDREIEVARIKSEIIRAVNGFDRQTAEMLLEYSVKPIDQPGRYGSFYNAYEDLLAKRGASEDSRASALDASIGESSVPPAMEKPADLVALFPGPDRGLASNRLVMLYDSQPDRVVEALVNGILPPSDPRSYRVNLYVAYTLARINSAWSGSRQQFDSVHSLTRFGSYSDPTFKLRVDQAIEHFKPKG